MEIVRVSTKQICSRIGHIECKTPSVKLELSCHYYQK